MHVDSQHAREKLQAAVAAAERETIGEIVPVVLGRSDGYAETRWMLALVFSLLATPLSPALWDRFATDASVGAMGLGLVAIEFVFAVVGYLLGGIPAIQRALVHSARIDDEVNQRAIQLFHALGVPKTAERCGILLFVSLAEHRVVLLADEGIHRRVASDAWNATVARLTARIQADGDWVAGLGAAIAELGEVLAREFPRGELPARNELPDHVVVDLS